MSPKYLEESENNLSKLYVQNLKYIGNLKYSATNSSDELTDSNKKQLNNFKTWCAASTHSGEELIVLKTHLEIKKKYENILTIIIPRHISRISTIKNIANNSRVMGYPAKNLKNFIKDNK